METILRILLISLVSFLGTEYARASNFDLDSIAVLLENGELDTAYRQLRQCDGNLNCEHMPDFHYYYGIVEELRCNMNEASMHFRECMKYSEQIDQIDESYVDAATRCINCAVNDGDWLSVVRLSPRALTAPDSILHSYPNTFNIYDWYVGALNALGKYEKISATVRRGQQYAEAIFRPTDKAYYNMWIAEIVAFWMMNKWDEAKKRIAEMDSISRTIGDNIMQHEIADLSDRIIESKATMDWRDDADNRVSVIYNAANSLLLESPAASPGKEEWNKFFYFIIKQLELLYFDINNPEDEKYWSRLLACAIVYFNTVGERMQEREKLAYDLILLRKNFLDYHSGLLHKAPARWETVKNSLAAGELAVEITMCPDEMLILGSDYSTPVAISIPDETITQIEQYNPNDAASISEFYSEDSPLTSLIALLSPYLTDIHTLYLSPTNLFAQFNYGAIPYNNGRLDDRYNFVQMTTTADIGHVKDKTKAVSIKQALLYGGIDYGEPKGQPSLTESRHSDLTRAISDTRSGFGYLPHTLTEVESIAALLQHSSLYTGKDASEQRMKATDWPRFDGVLHIATHGYSLQSPSINDSTGVISKISSIRSRSGLLLAGANYSLSGISTDEDDGVLTSQEIASFDMGNVELAVLSACSSGMGDLTNTTGVVYGVANAMKSAGVKNIIATLWDIPDEATALAMQSFYQHLLSGNGVARSLRLMRQDMINQGFSNPYYWASFVNLE